MKTHVNLLPIAYRRRQLLWQRCKQWLTIGAVAASIGAMLCWMQLSRTRRDRLRLEALRREYTEVKEGADKVEALKKDIEELRQRESIVLQLADERPILTLVGLISRATRTCEGGLCVQRLQLDRTGNDALGSHLKVLTLEGIATDNHLIARFADALRDSEAFARVELKSSDRRVIEKTEGQAYRLECIY